MSEDDGVPILQETRSAGQLVVVGLGGKVYGRGLTLVTRDEDGRKTITAHPAVWWPDEPVDVMAAWVEGAGGELIVRIELAQYPLKLRETDGFELGLQGARRA